MHKLTSEEYKERVLGVLVKVDQICRENGFTYMLCYGTLLGAVRHRGFIPWDDDIDIVMPRADYYRLADYLIAHPETGLNYIDIYNREDTIYYCAKICDAQTEAREATFRPVAGYGAFIDVFPLDYLPNDAAERAAYKKKALHWERIVQHSSKATPAKAKNPIHFLLSRGAFLYAHCYSTGKVIHKMHDTFMQNDREKTSYIGVPYGTSFHSDDFEQTTELEFEGCRFFAPYHYDRVLTASYGDYWKLPPEDKRISHAIECYTKEESKGS